MLTRRYWLTPLLLDIVSFAVAFAVSCQLLPWLERLFQTSYTSPGFADLLPVLGTCVLILLPLLTLADGYSLPRHWGGLRTLRMMFVVSASLVTIYLTLSLFASDQFAPGRKAVFVTAALSTFLLWYWRIIYPDLYSKADRKRRVLLVGAHTFAMRALQRYARDHAESFEIIGVADDFRSDAYFENLGLDRCGTSAQLAIILRQRPIDTVIVLTDQSLYADRIIALLDDVPTLQEVYVRAQVPLAVAQDIDLRFAQEVPLLKVFDRETRSADRWWSLLLDRGIAAAALLVLSPVFLLTAALIKLDSPGPVFYRQRRLGIRNRPFAIVKFRSMVADAESKSGAVLAQKNDPRVTRIGRIMRMLRIDELPQIWNVLVGDMSIIGPRPERPEFQNIYLETIPWYSLRSMHRPGITGLAQVSGDYHTSAQRKLLYDVTYLANIGPLLDMRILMATVLTVLTKKGH